MFKYWKRPAVVVSATLTGAALFVPAINANAASAKLVTVAVGSDTIYCLDQATVAKAARNYNVPPIAGIDLGCGAADQPYNVPSDTATGGVHGAESFDNSTPPAVPQAPAGPGTPCPGTAGNYTTVEFPDGSGAGITCYTTDAGAGHITYTRSSRGRASTDPANLEFWAFALDAVTWSTNAGSHAPAGLTPAQINAIVSCQDTTWGQVNGRPSDKTPITVYYPQSGSGTGAFFASQFLGGTYPTGNCVHFIEENTGTQVTSADAFYPYSYAVYTAQSTGVETNLTNGLVLKGVKGSAQSAVVTPKPTTITEAAAKVNTTTDEASVACTAYTGTAFCATRYVYHTIWNDVAAGYYKAGTALIGVNRSNGVAAATSYCSNAYASEITSYGFQPLTEAVTKDGALSVPGKSYCRLY